MPAVGRDIGWDKDDDDFEGINSTFYALLFL